jgi:cytoskeleton protein RodZ
MSRKRRRNERRPIHPGQAAPGAGATGVPHDAATGQGAAPGSAAAQAAARDAEPELPLDAATSIGMRLRSARNAAGLSIEDVARGSRIGVGILTAIESDDLSALGAPIYARGYLRAYARAVGLPEAAVAGALEARAVPTPALVATQRTSRTHYLASRYAPPLAYALLTLVVLVPLVMSLRPALSPAPVAMPELQPIDGSSTELGVPAGPVPALPPASPVAIVQSSAYADAVDAGPPEPSAPAALDQVDEPQRPVMASMAGMPEAKPAGPLASRRVVLRLSQQSWIELTGASGQRIEYGLLPAGSVREYQISGNASLRIGNVRGAALQIDGQAVDLAQHSAGNVARVQVGAEPAIR